MLRADIFKMSAKILLQFKNGSGYDIFDYNKKNLCDIMMCHIPCSTEDILKKIWGHIKNDISRYDKNGIYILSEFLREDYCRKTYKKSDFHTMTEINEIGIIIQMMITEDDYKLYGKRKIDKHLLDILENIKIFLIGMANMDFNLKINTIDDLKALFLPNSENNLNEFMDGTFIEQDSLKEKFENSDINHDDTKKYLELMQLNTKSLKKNLFNEISSELGFNYSEFSYFKNEFKYLNDCRIANGQNTHEKVLKDKLYEALSKQLDRCVFDKIIDCFNLNRYSSEFPNPRKMEILCFYQESEYILFATSCVLEVLEIFENLILSGHFGDEIGYGISETIESQYQNKLTQYFSYYCADLLHSKGLELPITNNGSFLVEIMDIGSKSNKVVFNDIDVLALDNKNMKMYNFELKYYKPALKHKKMIQSTIKKNLKKNIRERETKIIENKKEIGLELFSKDTSNYEVISAIITARPSMIPFSRNYNDIDMKDPIKCYSIVDIIKGRLI